ncbi:MAG: molybdenum cofactor biosynthesis protein MoaE [Betaproteobacteria bacterium]|nr:molybdenum cofactor biosynthesis protein MoaE [Betaproteobacteria bacterium]
MRASLPTQSAAIDQASSTPTSISAAEAAQGLGSAQEALPEASILSRPYVQVRVQTDDFQIDHLLAALRRDRPKIGAIACFVGTVRDLNQGDSVSYMFLEHYPGMTEQSLQAIAHQALERWQLEAVSIVQLTASAHRHDAFASCEFVMDFLKTEAPFWKKERIGGQDRWVQARDSDEAARKRWL